MIHVNQIDLTATISLKASVPHAPFTSKGHFDQDQWQLYHVDEDRSEPTDLAKQYPEKLDALKKAWDVEARINLALPMDDRTAVGDAGDSRNRYGGAG